MVRTRIKRRVLALCGAFACLLVSAVCVGSAWYAVSYTCYNADSYYCLHCGNGCIRVFEIPPVAKAIHAALPGRYAAEAQSWKLREAIRRYLSAGDPRAGKEYAEVAEDIKREVESEAATRYPPLRSAELLARYQATDAMLRPKWKVAQKPWSMQWLPRFCLRDASGSSLDIIIPLWIPFLIALGGTALLLWRTRRTPPVGHCQTCGYDLTGNVSGRCPECGAQTQPASERVGRQA